MRSFRLPLTVTGIALALGLAIVLVGATMIYRANLSNRQKEKRAQQFGQGVGVATCIFVAPFWWFAAAKVGKRRREARAAARAANRRDA